MKILSAVSNNFLSSRLMLNDFCAIGLGIMGCDYVNIVNKLIVLGKNFDTFMSKMYTFSRTQLRRV